MKFRLRRFFDRHFYLEKYDDLQRTELDPFQHFMEFGHFENRLPHPLFDTSHYRENYMVKGTRENPLVHYFRQAHSQANTHPLFDAFYYNTQLQALSLDGPSKNESYLEHYLRVGSQLNPSVFFDATEYINRHTDIQQTNPLYHFLRFGLTEQRET